MIRVVTIVETDNIISVSAKKEAVWNEPYCFFVIYYCLFHKLFCNLNNVFSTETELLEKVKCRT